MNEDEIEKNLLALPEVISISAGIVLNYEIEMNDIKEQLGKIENDEAFNVVLNITLTTDARRRSVMKYNLYRNDSYLKCVASYVSIYLKYGRANIDHQKNKDMFEALKVIAGMKWHHQRE